MEIPTLSKEEIQRAVTDLTMGMHLGYLGFIGEKLGQDAVKEVTTGGAKSEADMVKQLAMKEKGALKLAMHIGTDMKNIYGSEDVDVEGDENNATVSSGKCSSLITVKDFIKKGAPITREYCCGGCSGHYKEVAENLDLKFKVKFTDAGCRMTFAK